MNKFQKKISKMAKRDNEMFGVNYKRMKNVYINSCKESRLDYEKLTEFKKFHDSLDRR